MLNGMTNVDTTCTPHVHILQYTIFNYVYMPTSRKCGRPFELICPTLLAQCTGVFLQTGPKPWETDSAPTDGMYTLQ